MNLSEIIVRYPYKSFFLYVILTLCAFTFGPHKLLDRVAIPVTNRTEFRQSYVSSPIESRDAFVNSILNGESDQLVGVWLPGLTGLDVIYQPQNQPGYVNEKMNNVTVFQLAADFGSIGLLAHANKAGTYFHKLNKNQVIMLIYGDGVLVKYMVIDILEYQAVEPKNALTDFKSSDTTAELLTQEELFHEIYATPGRLILQTCIIKGNENYWGRKFIVAEKVK